MQSTRCAQITPKPRTSRHYVYLTLPEVSSTLEQACEIRLEARADSVHLGDIAGASQTLREAERLAETLE